MVVCVLKDIRGDSGGAPQNLSSFLPRTRVSWGGRRAAGTVPFGHHGDEARPALRLLLLGEGKAGLLLFYLKKCFK